MENPFIMIDIRLGNLENLILDLKHTMTPYLLNLENNGEGRHNKNIVDLEGLLGARPFVGSKSTIYKKVSSGEIPHSKSGKRLIFDLNEIDEWLLSNKIKTSKEIEAETEAYMKRRQRKRVKNL